jgi:hypothetical protein
MHYLLYDSKDIFYFNIKNTYFDNFSYILIILYMKKTC